MARRGRSARARATPSSCSRAARRRALYHRGLASVVALSHARDPQAVTRRLARLPEGQDVAGTARGNLGVPERAILRLEPEVQNTVEELAVVAEMSGARGFRRVILLRR